MKYFQSILVLIPPRCSQASVRQLVWNAMHIAEWIKCEAHFLVDLIDTPATQVAITAYNRDHRPAPSTLIIQPISDNIADRVLETIRKYSCSLVVFQDNVVLDPIKGMDERRLLEYSPSPILLLQKDYHFEQHPTPNFLVPLSGEKRLSESLAVSLRLANQTTSSVDFMHIMNPGGPCKCDQALETLGDQLHHEYSRMIDNIVSEASPYSTTEERRHLRHFFHCTGFTAPEIVKHLDQSPGAVLVLEWKGSLASGHAKIIKGILKKVHNPILFVKPNDERKSILRVGRQLNAA